MTECKHRRSSNKHDDGFSLVELLVVLAIIGLIASLALPQVLRYLGNARTDTAQTQIKSIESAMELYFIDNGQYPSDQAGIQALEKAPTDAIGWNGPYLKNAGNLKDPWGKPYIYKIDDGGTKFSVSSLGRDGKSGGAGEDSDITN